MDDSDAQRPADPDRVLEEMDEAAEVDEDLPADDSRKAVEQAWEDADPFEGEAPSG